MHLQFSHIPVEIYYKTTPIPTTPLVLFHALGTEGEKVWEEYQKTGGPDCCLAAIRVSDWEKTLSPWPAPKVFRGGSDFGSGADEHIQTLEKTILPVLRTNLKLPASPCFIAGYSFAGLFALYSLYRSDVFAGAVSASGSLWFPGFYDYALAHNMPRKPQSLYLSLGDREHRTKNEQMRNVASHTQMLYEHFQKQGINSIFESNPGNHFQDADQRLARGIHWILTNPRSDT